MKAIEFWEDKKMSLPEFRDKIVAAQAKMEAMPESVSGEALALALPTKHSFGDGLYVRERSAPRGTLLISLIHKYKHPFFMSKGKCAVLTEDGVTVMEAPFHGMTEPGTKRAVYIIEDTIWTTVHATEETDPDKIIDEITVGTFEELQEVGL